MIPVLLVLNAGSSSLKFQVFELGEAGDPRRVFRGPVRGARRFAPSADPGRRRHGRGRGGLATAPGLRPRGGAPARGRLAARAQRGLPARRRRAPGRPRRHGPCRARCGWTRRCWRRWKRLVPLAPLHQPHNLAPIRILRRRFPDLPQIACFDTAFHRSQPEIAQLFALPHAMTEAGVRRYGFHGLSYAYIASVLAEYDPALAAGRVVVAHLGNGASLCALNARARASRPRWASPPSTGCRWARAAAASMRASSSTCCAR